MSAHVGYDFFKYNFPRIEQRKTVQILEAHRYKINVGGREKQLTLVREHHRYNQTESDLAQKLVDEHQHFANECGSDALDKISLENYFYGLAIAIPLQIPDLYSILGHGRWHDSITDLAKGKGYKVQALEKPDDPFNNISTGDKIMFWGGSYLLAFTAPLAYYRAKEERPYDPSRLANFSFRESLVDRRDKVMTKGIIDLLKREEIDKLLATVGRAHLEGIISNLSRQVALQEIK